MLSRPSDLAVREATSVLGNTREEEADSSIALRALMVAHDQRLGLDRSVCLRSVVEALRSYDDGTNHDYAVAADIVERKFGGVS